MSVNAESLHQAERPRLTALAYRMLGERAEAKDGVQEAWLRWSRATSQGEPKIETAPRVVTTGDCAASD